MKYRPVDDRWTAIDPEGAPVEAVLLSLAKASYQSAQYELPAGERVPVEDYSDFFTKRPTIVSTPRRGLLAHFRKPKTDIKDEVRGLVMDYKNGLKLATVAIVTENGQILFDRLRFERERKENSEYVLEETKASLEELVD